MKIFMRVCNGKSSYGFKKIHIFNMNQTTMKLMIFKGGENK
jgi:hypothetical protein